jgi:hypothetical protein
MKPKQSDMFRDSAQNCAEMAERALHASALNARGLAGVG